MSQVNIVGSTSGSNVQLTNVVLDVYSKDILFQAQPSLRFESVAVKRTELGVQPGKTIQFLKYQSLTGASAIAETTRISTDVISTSLVSITVGEHAKAVAFSEFLLRSAFTDILRDSAELLGKHYAKSRDGLCRDTIFNNITNVVYSKKAGAAAARADLVSSSTFNLDVVRDAVEILATNKAPKFNGNDYVGFVHPHQGRFLRSDSAWVNVQNYATPENMLSGEIGRIEDVRFIETTQCPYIVAGSGATAVYTDGADSGTTATGNPSTDVYRAVIVADYCLGLADALPVEMRDNGVDDFGRTHALAYYCIQGAGIIEGGHAVICETA